MVFSSSQYYYLQENYQERVKASLECLDLPDWYKHSSQHLHLNILHSSTPTSTTPSWRSPPASSSYKSSQWRLEQGRTEPRNPVRSVRNYASSSYCGWRSSRADSENQNNFLVTNPSQRLAKTITEDNN